MGLTILAGSANVPLAEAVAEKLGIRLGSREVEVFPDGELHVEIQESVRGEDVYLLQPTSPPRRSTFWSYSCWPTPPTGQARLA